jgi:hypothetical protein
MAITKMRFCTELSWVGRHRRRVSEGMTGLRECPRIATSMHRPMRAAEFV